MWVLRNPHPEAIPTQHLSIWMFCNVSPKGSVFELGVIHKNTQKGQVNENK